ncbi:MAG: type II toxin-antitoxin system VapB family antitoxin [Candidatus Rokubacteria bacterium]|nr:type II toxin-antitoxin system VapB family antitoxin [Candidatus Rokubacteria bacterium]
MRTTVNLPDDLLTEAMKLSQEKTRTATIVAALREYIRARRVERLIARRGKLEFTGHWERGRHAR